jgi:nucleoside-diphosphate-sugar epimerase
MLALVTGGTGFLGGHLIDALLREDFCVRTLIREHSHYNDLSKKGVQICVGDLTDYNSLREAVKGAQVVFHCGALVTDWARRNEYERINVEGTRNLLDAATLAKVEKFIHVSTSDVFGITGNTLVQEDHPYSPSGFAYPDSKIAAEQIVFDYHKRGQIRVSVIYPLWLFGPGDKTLIPEVVSALRSRTMILIRGGISPIHLSYVENVAQAMVLMSRKEEALGEGFLIFDEGGLTWRDFIWRIADLLGVKRPRVSLDPFLANGFAGVQEAVYTILSIRSRPILTRYIVRLLSNNLTYDGSKIDRVLGYKPRIRLEEALEGTLSWLSNRKATLAKVK